MSRDNLLPPFLKRLHPKYLTPVITIAITCGVMALVITFLEVEKIAKLASAFKVMMFIAVNASLIVLRETAVQWYQPSYKSPMYPWIQIFGILSGIALLIILGGLALIAALLITLIGTFVYFIYGRHNSSRSGVLKTYGHRPASYLLGKRKTKKGAALRAEKATAFEIEKKNRLLSTTLTDQAGTVIPLFGSERSPEMLVEMGAALAHGRKVEVVHLIEVPDITDLDALLEDSPVITSLNRRITAMSQERQVDVNFESAVTHDLVETVQAISEQTHCNWLVAGWDGKSGQGLFIRNPIGWLVTHIDSNFALFKDNGVRYIHKILIAIAPGKEGKDFIIACDRIAKFYGAEITLVRVVDIKVSEADAEQLRIDSEKLLVETESKSEAVVIRGTAPVKAIAEASAAYDLLIIGTPVKQNRFDIMLGSDKDKFANSAACSVLRLSIN